MICKIEFLTLNESLVNEIIKELILTHNFKISGVLEAVYLTDTIMYERKIKEIDSSKKPSLDAVGQFIFLNNKAYLVLNYDKVKHTFYSLLVHELTHIENHLTFIKNDDLKRILNDAKDGKLMIKDFNRFIALDLVDEFLSIKNETYYNKTYGYNDYLDNFLIIINTIKEEIKNKNLNKKDFIYCYLINGYFKILPYILAYKNETDSFPNELTNHLLDMTLKIKKEFEFFVTQEELIINKIYAIEKILNL